MTASTSSVSCDASTSQLMNPTGAVRKARHFGSGQKDSCKWAPSLRPSAWPLMTGHSLGPLYLAIEVRKKVVEQRSVL